MSALPVLTLQSARLAPPDASNWAAHVDRVFLVLLVFSALLAGGVAAAMVYFAVRYRAGAKVERPGRPRRTTPFEVTWIVAPTLVAGGLFWWGASGYVAMHSSPPGAYTVVVVGKQWMWKVLHPGGRQEVDALHLPAGRPARVLLVSQDVIHSFFVPAFRVKQDALPDRYTSIWFEPTRTGRFDWSCAEYCGVGHSRMRGEVVVLEPGEFDAWLDAGAPGPAVPGTPGTPGAPLALDGDGPLQRHGCIACHVPGAAVRAPRLDGLFGRQVRLRNGSLVLADEDYLRRAILRPNDDITAGYEAPSLMPAYEGQLDELEVAALVQAIRGLRDGWEATER